MSKNVLHDSHHRRRVGIAVVGALAFHVGIGLLPLPRSWGTWGLREGAGGGSARGAPERFASGALQGTEIVVRTPPAPAAPRVAPPSETLPEPPEVSEAEISVPEDPPPDATAPQTSTAGAQDASRAAAASGAPGEPEAGDAPGQGDSGKGDPGGGLVPTGPIQMNRQPRVTVWPQIPEKIVRKNKINDYVLLEILVGKDGLVREVRVLRSIANCEECTQSAIAAARRQRYDAVLLDGNLVEYLTTARYDFNYRP